MPMKRRGAKKQRIHCRRRLNNRSENQFHTLTPADRRPRRAVSCCTEAARSAGAWGEGRSSLATAAPMVPSSNTTSSSPTLGSLARTPLPPAGTDLTTMAELETRKRKHRKMRAIETHLTPTNRSAPRHINARSVPRATESALHNFQKTSIIGLTAPDVVTRLKFVVKRSLICQIHSLEMSIVRYNTQKKKKKN